MVRAVIFGGTTEGRKLCESCAGHDIPVLYCAATADGARRAEALPNVKIHRGRLGAVEMQALLEKEKPALVVDATHPYAQEAGRNIRYACQNAEIPLLRVLRESIKEQGCTLFSSIDALLARLEREPGNVFVAAGSSLAGAFAKLPDYKSRVWLRILPSMDSLHRCLNLGYRPERLICMQGPFSEGLNRAMFETAEAGILVTKNSGAAGGFPEKIRAAQSLGMFTAVLMKPDEAKGISLSEAWKRVRELKS